MGKFFSDKLFLLSINPINVENICASEDAASLQVFLFYFFNSSKKKVKVKFFSGLIATKLFLIDAEKVFIFFTEATFLKVEGLTKKKQNIDKICSPLLVSLSCFKSSQYKRVEKLLLDKKKFEKYV
jgi:hypothetical protein